MVREKCPCGLEYYIKCQRCKQYPQDDDNPEIYRYEPNTVYYDADHESRDENIRKKRILTYKQRWPALIRRIYGIKVIGLTSEKPWRLESYTYHKIIEEQYPAPMPLPDAYSSSDAYSYSD